MLFIAMGLVGSLGLEVSVGELWWGTSRKSRLFFRMLPVPKLKIRWFHFVGPTDYLKPYREKLNLDK